MHHSLHSAQHDIVQPAGLETRP